MTTSYVAAGDIPTFTKAFSLDTLVLGSIPKKLKLFHYTPQRPLGGEEV
jgi:hypothetical protein